MPNSGKLPRLKRLPPGNRGKQWRIGEEWRFKHIDFASNSILAALKRGSQRGSVAKVTVLGKQPATIEATIEANLRSLMTVLNQAAIEGVHATTSPVGFPDDSDQDHLIFDEITREQRVNNEIWWAVRFYLFERQSAQPRNEFRVHLATFGEGLKAFLSVIPSSDSPIAVALKNAWMNGHHEDLDCLICGDGIDPELYWDARFGFEQLQSDLALMQKIIDKMCDEESGRGKDANRAEHVLVANLARIFENFTGNKPTRNGYSGAFFDFIDAINGKLPADFRLTGIDHLIRSYLEQQRG
jgi:hypothetical protein